MSMQSLLVVNGYASLKEALYTYDDGGPVNQVLGRCLTAFVRDVVMARANNLDYWRTLPDLERGVKHQQYPQFGHCSWPYIKRKHTHDRNDKHGKHPYPRPLDCGDGLAVWSAAGKRFAKRINNKRRRAEDRHEIAREMSWLSENDCSDVRLEVDRMLSRSAANVFVPAAPECFKSARVYGMPVPVDHYRVACYSNDGDYIANVAKDYQ